MNVLMVGVDDKRLGGMWTVAETYIKNKRFNAEVNLYYVATSTCGSAIRRLFKMLQGYIRILFVLMFMRVDIVHVHMAGKGSVYRKGFVVRIAKLFEKKVIVQMHAGSIMDWYDSLTAHQQKIVKKIFNSPDKVLVLGEYWRDQLTRLIPNEKIDVLYNGAECSISNSYNNEGNIILYMGLIKKAKGTFDLVDAIDQINEDLDSDIKVYICGADEEGSIVHYIREKALEDRIVLPGWISKEQRLELFENTIISVLPSYFEALSMTVIESMCYGIPVITTNITTMSELLGNSIDLVTPGDVKELGKQILMLTEDRSLREKVSDIEHRRAKELFSVEKNIESTLNIYYCTLNPLVNRGENDY